MEGDLSMKSTRSSANQWKDLRNSKTVNKATNFGEKSSLQHAKTLKHLNKQHIEKLTYLNTVNARHVSVTAYHDRSIRCSNSAALSRPKKILRTSLPKRMTKTNACT